MQSFIRLTLVLITAASFSLRAQPVRDIGKIEVIAENKTLPIRVSANTPELNALALQAFGTHGRYRLVASGFAFDIKFSAVTPTQVRVDITKTPSGTPVASEVVTGSSARNALLKAADVAVVKTNGLGLRGYFAAKLAFINERTGKKRNLHRGCDVRRSEADHSRQFDRAQSPLGTGRLAADLYQFL